MNSHRKYFIVGSIIWSLFILSMTVIPASELPKVRIQGIDKLVHFILFFGFGFLVSGSVYNGKGGRFLLLTTILAIIYGITVEWLQRFIPGRTVDQADILFNFLGSLAGIGFFIILRKKFKI